MGRHLMLQVLWIKHINLHIIQLIRSPCFLRGGRVVFFRSGYTLAYRRKIWSAYKQAAAIWHTCVVSPYVFNMPDVDYTWLMALYELGWKLGQYTGQGCTFVVGLPCSGTDMNMVCRLFYAYNVIKCNLCNMTSVVYVVEIAELGIYRTLHNTR